MKFSEIWYINENAPQKPDFRFLPFFAKIYKNEENWQNPNRSMIFSEIWYVDASQQNKMLNKFFFGFWPFLVVF